MSIGRASYTQRFRQPRHPQSELGRSVLTSNSTQRAGFTSTIHGLSRPKNQVRWLLLEGISQSARIVLEKNGFTNVEHVSRALDQDALIDKLQGVHVLGIRSQTNLTERVLETATSLVAVGCFCTGTNQVDLYSTLFRGIPVFNTPFSNTRSVAELTIAEIVMLFRGVFSKSNAAHNGDWRKTAAGSHEVRGKTLGIVGYGSIGTQLAHLAEAMGMRVVYFDTADRLRHGNVMPMPSLDALLAESDVVSLHVPDTPDTRNMIRAEHLAKMKNGAFLINNARGKIVDISALAESLYSGRLAGAAIDVFPVEPRSKKDRFDSPLRGLDNVILTPHIGGSTEEAQERIGEEVSKRLVEYFDVGSTTGAVFFPQIRLPKSADATRFTYLHRNTHYAMPAVNDLLNRYELNVSAHYSQSFQDVGYLVLDIDSPIRDPAKVYEEVSALPITIRARMLNSD